MFAVIHLICVEILLMPVCDMFTDDSMEILCSKIPILPIKLFSGYLTINSKMLCLHHKVSYHLFYRSNCAFLFWVCLTSTFWVWFYGQTLCTIVGGIFCHFGFLSSSQNILHMNMHICISVHLTEMTNPVVIIFVHSSHLAFLFPFERFSSLSSLSSLSGPYSRICF